MNNKIFKFNAKIENVNYYIERMDRDKKINWKNLNINDETPSFLLEIDETFIGISKWVSPKRTRSEPFSRVYKTLGELKKITIIPIQKDEGFNGDHDQINATTLAWMNLLGVYIILAYYSDADRNKNKTNKITNQKLDNKYIIGMIKEIMSYQSDAHHWNNFHFTRDFEKINTISRLKYKEIGAKLDVKMHLFQEKEVEIFVMDDFIKKSNLKSEQAVLRELKTIHKFESLDKGTKKGMLIISNFYNGIYNLTCDEVIFDANTHIYTLQESKNTTKSYLPSKEEINDALFKTLLFSNIDNLYLEKEEVKFEIRIKLTSNKINGEIILPAKKLVIMDFLDKNKKLDPKYIDILNKESKNRTQQTNKPFSIKIKSNE